MSPPGPPIPFGADCRQPVLNAVWWPAAQGSPQRWTRTRGLAASSGLKDILLHVCLAGSGGVEADGRVRGLEPGDIGILDLARPAICDMPAFQRLFLIVPRDRLAALLAQGSPHGLVIPARSPLCCLLRTHVQMMAQLAGRATAGEAEDMLDAGILLLERAVRSLGDLPADPKTALRATCRLAVMDYIDANLTDQQLSPERLAGIFRMSRATLYRLFEDEGGVAALIQSHRLDRCFLELARSGGRGRVLGVGEVAYTHGFGSEAHFSRIFRRRFGISPSEARGRLPAQDAMSASGPQSDPQRLHRWLSGLGPTAKRYPARFHPSR